MSGFRPETLAAWMKRRRALRDRAVKRTLLFAAESTSALQRLKSVCCMATELSMRPWSAFRTNSMAKILSRS